MKLFDNTARPKMTWLNVNRQCNFRCKWCYTESGGFSPKDRMSLSFAEHLIDISKAVDLEHVNFIGGEPTMWKPLEIKLNYDRPYYKAWPVKDGKIVKEQQDNIYYDDAFISDGSGEFEELFYPWTVLWIDSKIQKRKNYTV